MKRLTLAILLALAACEAAPPPKPSASAVVPPALQVCPDGAALPAPPPTPRTIGQIIDWSGRVQAAWWQTERARQICSNRLTRLNQWIEDRLVTAKD